MLSSGQAAGLGCLALRYFAKSSTLTRRVTRHGCFSPSLLAEQAVRTPRAGYHAHSGAGPTSNLDSQKLPQQEALGRWISKPGPLWRGPQVWAVSWRCSRGGGKAALCPGSSASWYFNGIEVLGCVLQGGPPLHTQ